MIAGGEVAGKEKEVVGYRRLREREREERGFGVLGRWASHTAIVRSQLAQLTCSFLVS